MKHGTDGGYHHGCSCEKCRTAHAMVQRKYRANEYRQSETAEIIARCTKLGRKVLQNEMKRSMETFGGPRGVQLRGVM